MQSSQQTDNGEATTSAPDAPVVFFGESVRASNVAFAFTGGIYVALIALFIGVPIVNGMEDSGAWVFCAVMAVSIAVLSFFLANFMVLRNTVTAEGLEFRFGILIRRFSWSQLLEAEAKRYRWLDYGGWGIRWVPGGRRAWSLFGVPEGVLVKVMNDKGNRMSYFISSTRPQELSETLQRGIEKARES